MSFIHSLWYTSKKHFSFIQWIVFLLLYPYSLIYGFIIKSRQNLYSKKILNSFKANIPIVIIGNIVTGGGGKTPTVIALALALKKMGIKVGIISRGYGAKIDNPIIIQNSHTYNEVGDEPLLIYKQTLLPVCVHAKRKKSIAYLLNEYTDLQLIISDDGLQHLQMQRTIECVVFNDNIIGNGALIPAGPLREKIRTWDYTLSNYENVSNLQSIIEQSHSKYISITRSSNNLYLLNNQANKVDISFFKGKKAVLMAGIANPSSLANFLQQNGIKTIIEYVNDHALITKENFMSYNSNQIDLIIITEKDAVKAHKNLQVWAGNIPIWVITLEVNLPQHFIDDIAQLAHNNETKENQLLNTYKT